MNIDERNEGGIPVALISGDIDLESSPKLRAFLRSKAQVKLSRLILDLSDVNYIDSSGLATLIEYYNLARAHGGKLALASLTPRVNNAFKIVRLDQIFSIKPDVASALALFSSQISS